MKKTTPEKPTDHQKQKSIFRLFATGFGMGTADLIPGVSGGTIAFIFGIYEELIQSIKTVTGTTLQLLFKGKIKEALASIPFRFLIPLAVGLFSAILALSHVISWLLSDYPTYVWGFFFGLVIASAFIVARRVVSWDAHDILAAIAAAVGAYFLVGAVPVETPETWYWFFFSGFIAIIAMILPGISGSFILVLLGKYQQVLDAVNSREVLPLLILMAGCVIGISIFSRVLSWLFTHHHDITIAILTGFLVGSLRKIWPWKVPVLTMVDSHGNIEPIVEQNILPAVDPAFFAVTGLMAAGILIMWFFEKVQATKQHIKDIDDPAYQKKHSKAVEAEKHNPIV